MLRRSPHRRRTDPHLVGALGDTAGARSYDVAMRLAAWLFVTVTALLAPATAHATRPVPQPPTGDVTVTAKSHGRAVTVGAASFCADPNGEPVALACDPGFAGRRTMRLPVHRGGLVQLSFGAPVLSGRWFVQREDDRTIGPAMTPLRWADDRRRSAFLYPLTAPIRARRVLLRVEVAYLDPVRLQRRDSQPFANAVAEFRVDLVPHRHG